jgi:hypothetical protein
MKQLHASILAGLALLGALPSSALGEESQWHCVFLEPNFDHGWTKFEGDTAIEFVGQSFHVKFLSDAKPGQGELELDLRGTVQGRHVVATATFEGTDAGPEKFAGRLMRNRTKLSDPSNGWGNDRIFMTSGPAFI